MFYLVIIVCQNFVYILFYFFCSSRRRHTRFSRDWSSDVCSSDLRRWNSTLCRARDKLSPLLRRRARPESRPRQLPLQSDRTSAAQASIVGRSRLCPVVGYRLENQG